MTWRNRSRNQAIAWRDIFKRKHTTMDEPDNSKVICPQCCHQFGAISVDDQTERRRATEELERLKQLSDSLAAYGLKTHADLIAVFEARNGFRTELERIANCLSPDCARDPFLCKALARAALHLPQETHDGQ